MNVSVVVATSGDSRWRELAAARARPSALVQGFQEVIAFHAPEGTVSGARNAAAATAIGDWLCFLDADDELAPGYLAAMTAESETPRPTPLVYPRRPSLLAPAVEYVQPTGAGLPFSEKITALPSIPNLGRWPHLNECVIGTLVPRRLFWQVGGFDEDLPSLEDYDLWLRCVLAGAEIVHVPGAVYRAWVNTDGRNRDQSPYDEIVARYPAVFR